jgi:hypothetical protein
MAWLTVSREMICVSAVTPMATIVKGEEGRGNGIPPPPAPRGVIPKIPKKPLKNQLENI